MEQVRKRSGRVEKFSRRKLLESLHAALHWAGISDMELEEKLTADVVYQLKRKTVSREDIRSAVCASLKKEKHHQACDFYSLVWLHAKPVKIRSVIKRHGSRERFSPEKLFKSVQKAFKHSRMNDGKLLELVVRDALAMLGRKY